MTDVSWQEIIDSYKTARFCLWCPKHVDNWSRDDKKGYYHLWFAYYHAENAKEKRQLWYGRILHMMAWEYQHSAQLYVVINRYLAPCLEAYKAAMNTDEKPTDEEYKQAQELYEHYAYQLDNCCSKNYDKSCTFITGWDDSSDFQFHDSEFVSFSQDKGTATLKLKYYDLIATFVFDDVVEAAVLSIDPQYTWIDDFNCYTARHDQTQLVFDIGSIKIQCKSITMTCNKSSEA